jgi:hypothetical protein
MHLQNSSEHGSLCVEREEVAAVDTHVTEPEGQEADRTQDAR